MKYKVMILFMVVMVVSRIIHKNLTNVSTEKVHFQETIIVKSEDNICHYFAKEDNTFKMGKTYTTLEDCIKDGGEFVKPNINKK